MRMTLLRTLTRCRECCGLKPIRSRTCISFDRLELRANGTGNRAYPRLRRKARVAIRSPRTSKIARICCNTVMRTPSNPRKTVLRNTDYSQYAGLLHRKNPIRL